MAPQYFRNLFQPVKIGGMTLKNRIAMAPMGTSFFSKEGFVTLQAINYYKERARGGAGMIIVESTSVDFPRGIQALYRPVIHNDDAISGLSELVKVIKKHGARAIIQLNHAGRIAKSTVTGVQPVAPSPIPYPPSAAPPGEMPRELTIGEISDLIDLFVQGAIRARKAGFDGIELHAAHHYLLAEFLSSFSNKRQDLYGGSIKNRARMLIDVLKAIRQSVGTDYPLWFRINGKEYGIEDGLTLDESRMVVRMAGDIVDAIHVSAWGYNDEALAHLPDTEGALLPLAEAIKHDVTLPVITVGRLSYSMAEQILQEGKADVIAMGRELLADPELPNKVLSGKVDEIKPCIACFHCNDAGNLKNSQVVCSVNAALGKENESQIRPAENAKKIVVVGGGPAGMEAARVLALRGHMVVLLEKEGSLGGQMFLASIPPHKERIQPFISYLIAQLRRLNVDIRLNIQANLEYIKSFNPDAVILAIGSVPIIPQIRGVELNNVVTAHDVLAGRVEVNSSVLVIGGGVTGCETAEFLLESGKTVTVVEILPDLATDTGYRDRLRLLLRIGKLPIKFIMNAKCIEIKNKGVTIIKENTRQFIESGTVVLAVGVKRNNTVEELLKEKEFVTYLAGDCAQGRRIADAIADGFKLGVIL